MLLAILSRVMRKYNSVTYEVGKAKAEQAAGMFGLAAGQRAASWGVSQKLCKRTSQCKKRVKRGGEQRS